MHTNSFNSSKSHNSIDLQSAFPNGASVNFGHAAVNWLQFGFDVIPIVRGTKRTATMWNPWLAALSYYAIQNHWAEHPAHELGFIVGKNYIVFDADSPESIAALTNIETKFGVTPALAVRTSKGMHHYYALAAGTYARSDSHCTNLYPDRIDVKTGRAMVMLPPSPGKEIITSSVTNAVELSCVNQEFIDAVFRNNGRAAPRKFEDPVTNRCSMHDCSLQTWRLLCELVYRINPDSGYDDWLRVGMIIFNETGGSDAGLALFAEWSSEGKKYKNMREISSKWDSFIPNHPNPVTINTLKYMVQSLGYDWREIQCALEDQFETFDTDTECGA
jgi:hypothetical protein